MTYTHLPTHTHTRGDRYLSVYSRIVPKKISTFLNDNAYIFKFIFRIRIFSEYLVLMSHDEWTNILRGPSYPPPHMKHYSFHLNFKYYYS